MTDKQQPKALRLADAYEATRLRGHMEAAAELRRLHAECEHRMQAINGLTRLANSYHEDLITLRTAIKKLHSSRGRYHTQIAACDLYDMCNLKNERPTK